MRKVRIVSKVVSKDDNTRVKGYLCVDVAKAMRSYEEGFKKMETLSEMYLKEDLAKLCSTGELEVVNGVFNKGTGLFDITDVAKNKEITLTTGLKLTGDLAMPLMVVGKVIYDENNVAYRVSNSLGSVHELSYKDLIAMMVDGGRTVVNCKILKKKNMYVISSIKGELPVRKVKKVK